MIRGRPNSRMMVASRQGPAGSVIYPFMIKKRSKENQTRALITSPTLRTHSAAHRRLGFTSPTRCVVRAIWPSIGFDTSLCISKSKPSKPRVCKPDTEFDFNHLTECRQDRAEFNL